MQLGVSTPVASFPNEAPEEIPRSPYSLGMTLISILPIVTLVLYPSLQLIMSI